MAVGTENFTENVLALFVIAKLRRKHSKCPQREK